ncbi:MAG: HD domain-containing protein [Spirochaetota bacterium]
MDVKDNVLWHLDRDYTQPVRDPLWGHIYLSEGLVSILDSLEFQQLSKIKQLGPAHLVYPGATHTRLAHSLGVYHISYRMIRALLTYASAPTLGRESVAAYLCAALLHDLGHFPFTHSLKELPLAEHEALAAEMVQEGDLAKRIREDVGTDPIMVARIIDESMDDGGSSEIRLFRRLLSGSLDPDKLDYLNRDAYFCGVPYGTQDIDFAISRLRPNGETGIALEVSGISAVENILFSKYLMYRAVYWHRNVRVATAMIKEGLYHGLTEGLISENDLYGLTDESFFAGFSSRPEPPFELIRRVYDRQLYVSAQDIAFDDHDGAHRRLQQLEHRSRVEERLRELVADSIARRVDPLSVLIDIPESVSFEVSFPVIDGDRVIDYPDAGTVFTPHVIEDFTRTLRRIRLILEPGIASQLTNPRELLLEAISMAPVGKP